MLNWGQETWILIKCPLSGLPSSHLWNEGFDSKESLRPPKYLQCLILRRTVGRAEDSGPFTSEPCGWGFRGSKSQHCQQVHYPSETCSTMEHTPLWGSELPVTGAEPGGHSAGKTQGDSLTRVRSSVESPLLRFLPSLSFKDSNLNSYFPPSDSFWDGPSPVQTSQASKTLTQSPSPGTKAVDVSAKPDQWMLGLITKQELFPTAPSCSLTSSEKMQMVPLFPPWKSALQRQLNSISKDKRANEAM